MGLREQIERPCVSLFAAVVRLGMGCLTTVWQYRLARQGLAKSALFPVREPVRSE